MIKLQESAFLTVNLQTLFEPLQDQTDSKTTKSSPDTGVAKDTGEATKIDWEKKLKQQVEANKALSAEARRPDHEIEKELFFAFFKANWGEELAKLLINIGPKLRHAIKILGFKKQTNPILAFLSLSYVKNNLIQTELLNTNTFEVIYESVANKWIVDSEFYKANNYNIIYCKDFYKKSQADMISYIKLQQNILATSAEIYSVSDQEKNRRAFLFFNKNTEKELGARAKKQLELVYNRLPSMRDNKALLNPLDLVKTILGVHEESSENTKTSNKLTGAKAVQVIENKVKTPAQAMALLQFISTATGNEKAFTALTNKVFREVSLVDLMKASKQIMGLTTKIKFTSAMADILADRLVNKIY